MKRWFIGGGILAIFLVGVLFPYGVLADNFSIFRRLFYGTLGSEKMHWIGHFSIFFCLGLLLLFIFPRLRTLPLWYGLIILVSAIGQEFFQLLYKQRRVVFDDFKDIAIDLAGAVVAFGLVWFWQKLKIGNRSQRSVS
jgi:VanZ family protein